jgi:hypothetical protein
MVFFNFLPGLASDCIPPDLCLPNSWVLGVSHWPGYNSLLSDDLKYMFKLFVVIYLAFLGV